MHATLPAACNGCGVERRDESLERVFGVTFDADFKKRLDDVLQDVGWLHLFRQELRTARFLVLHFLVSKLAEKRLSRCNDRESFFVDLLQL